MVKNPRKAWTDTVREISSIKEPQRKRETRRRAATRNKTLNHEDVELAELRAAARVDHLLDTQYYEVVVDSEDEDDPRKKRIKKDPDAARERRLRPRNVAQMILDDFQGKDWDGTPDWISALAGPSRYPSQKYCVITGEPAKYTDPATGCPYASIEAFNELRENPPPWVNVRAGAPYFEAIKQIQQERQQQIDNAKKKETS